MLRTTALLAFLLATPATAQIQQDKTYTLVLTGQEIATIAGLLNEAPYKQAQPILQKLIEQTTKPKEEPATAPAK